jgi:hypothetical protein
VATLSIPTIDGRLVDVFVATTLGDYFIVHDGGKAINELILQGVDITDSITKHFDALARRFNVSYTDETFKATVRLGDIQGMPGNRDVFWPGDGSVGRQYSSSWSRATSRSV